MKRVFADTHFWIAITVPGDPWADAAKKAKASQKNAIIVTSDEVLTEFATGLSRYGPALRQQAVDVIRAILNNPNVRVIAQTRESFLKGLARYEQRPDKQYSLTDCVSMNVMDAEQIREVLMSWFSVK